MNLNDAKEIIKIVKKEPLSVLIIFSLIFLPVIFLEWVNFFQESWRPTVIVVIILLWIFALYIQWREIKVWRRKTILVNYLKKYKQRSIRYLSTEWDAKKEFTEKNINDLLLKYPDELKRVTMAKGKNPGVGLVSNTTEEEIKDLGKN